MIWDSPTLLTSWQVRLIGRLLDALEARGREPEEIRLSPARLHALRERLLLPRRGRPRKDV